MTEMNAKRYRGSETSESYRDTPLRVVIDGRLLDIDKLARELAVILENDEDEVGLTPIMHVLDNAIEQAIGDGSEAVEEKDEPGFEDEDGDE